MFVALKHVVLGRPIAASFLIQYSYMNKDQNTIQNDRDRTSICYVFILFCIDKLLRLEIEVGLCIQNLNMT